MSSAVIKRLVAALVLSGAGAVAIVRHEGMKQRAYVDPVGVVTVCAGHTRSAELGQYLSIAQCTELLKQDVRVAETAIKRYVKVPITQGQYDALVSLAFNVGNTSVANSTLVRKLNAGDCYGAAREFDRWVWAKGQKLPGLVTRRADERRIFEAGCKT